MRKQTMIRKQTTICKQTMGDLDNHRSEKLNDSRFWHHQNGTSWSGHHQETHERQNKNETVTNKCVGLTNLTYCCPVLPAYMNHLGEAFSPSYSTF